VLGALTPPLPPTPPGARAGGTRHCCRSPAPAVPAHCCPPILQADMDPPAPPDCSALPKLWWHLSAHRVSFTA